MLGEDPDRNEENWEVVSVRVPPHLKDGMETLAERLGATPSDAWRSAAWFAVETNQDQIELSIRVENRRDEIIQRYKPIDMAGGFAGRVKKDFEKRFRNHYKPKWLASKAESYREEAEMLEQLVAKHPAAPEIEEGELVEEVERELADALEAMDLTNWYKRRDNRYEKYGGVEDAKERRAFYISAVQGAMETRDRIDEAFTAVPALVTVDDLPDEMADPLPIGVDLADVARAANQLAEMGVEPPTVPEALREFDPAAWRDADEEPDEEPVDDLPDDPEPVEPAEADQPDEPGRTDGGPHAAADGGEIHTAEELVEWAAQTLVKGKVTGSKVEPDEAERDVRNTLTSDTRNWKQDVMTRESLTADELVDLADNYAADIVDHLNDPMNTPEPTNPMADPETAADTEAEA